MSYNVYHFTTSSEEETDRLGQRLLDLLPKQGVVALFGTLGAGKTRLVQAIAQAAGINPETVSSPTFVLLHEYQGTIPIYHFDVYRLKNEKEFFQLGPDEYFDRSGLTFIEWADRVETVLPKRHVRICIDILGEKERFFSVSIP